MKRSSAAADPGEHATRFGQGFLPDSWWFAALARDLRPGKLQRVVMLGEPVLLGRTAAGETFALRDICPHRAAPLSAGRVTAEPDGAASVECPYHGWRFGAADGVCRSIPALTAEQLAEGRLQPERIRVRRYPVRESQGLLFVWFGAGAPDDAPPVFPGAVGGAPKLVERTTFAAHIDHAVVGLMDPAHGPYVHRQWWWRSEHSMHDKSKAFGPVERGFAMLRHAPSSNSRFYRVLGGAPATEISFRLPAYRWEHIQVGSKQVLALTCLTPVDARATRIVQLIWSDHWVFSLVKPVVGWMARRFLEQDGDMVDLQNQGLTYDPSLLWIDDADTQAKWYQQLKREWVASRRDGRAFANPVQATTLRWRS